MEPVLTRNNLAFDFQPLAWLVAARERPFTLTTVERLPVFVQKLEKHPALPVRLPHALLKTQCRPSVGRNDRYAHLLIA
jgi:hypothetical protein